MVLAGDLGVDHMRVREHAQRHITLHNEVSMISLPTINDYSHTKYSNCVVIIYVQYVTGPAKMDQVTQDFIVFNYDASQLMICLNH